MLSYKEPRKTYLINNLSCIHDSNLQIQRSMWQINCSGSYFPLSSFLLSHKKKIANY